MAHVPAHGHPLAAPEWGFQGFEETPHAPEGARPCQAALPQALRSGRFCASSELAVQFGGRVNGSVVGFSKPTSFCPREAPRCAQGARWGKQARGSRKRVSREVFLAGCAREGHPPAQGAPVTPLLWFGQTGRSAFQCLQKFQQHNTALKRKEWTEQEDRMLTQLVQEMRVGSHIPYRKSKAVPGGPRPRPCLGPRPRPRAGGTRGWGWFLRGWKKSGCPWLRPQLPGGSFRGSRGLSAPSRLLHGRQRLHAAHLPVDQELGSQPEKGLLGPRGRCGRCGGPRRTIHLPSPWRPRTPEWSLSP